MFKKNQTVWDAMFGPGVVTRILAKALVYPVEVTFHDGHVEWFTQGGRQFIMEDQPSLVKVWE